MDVKITPRKTFYSMYGKRIFDLIVSFILIILLFPFIFPIIIIIGLFGCKNIVFKHERVGKDKRMFIMYKFRTMVLNADRIQKKYSHLNESDSPTFKIKDDPRLTSFGKWLRSTGLDELPQIINVFGGSMSLVGPRPHTFRDISGYSNWHFKRLLVKPGITSLWHINGRHEISFNNWVKCDIYYILNQSFFLDLKVLFKTFYLFFKNLIKSTITNNHIL